MHYGSSGRIDVREGIDPAAVEAYLREQANSRGLEYHVSDMEGVLRNTGYDQGVSLDEALRNAVENYDRRAAD